MFSSPCLSVNYFQFFKFSTVFHNFLLLWSEPPSLYRNPFLVCSGEPVFCLLYTFRAWINKLLRSPSPPSFMFPCLNVVNFLMPPTEPLVTCGCETVHFEKETIVQCCEFEFFPPGSRIQVKKHPSILDPHQSTEVFLTQKMVSIF